MTSDAKIGLLLGLVFIFIIAFVINGLPRFRSTTNGSEMTTKMVSPQTYNEPISSKERQTPGVFSWTEKDIEQTFEETQPPAEQKEDIRFEMQLPDKTEVAKNISIIEIADQAEPTVPEEIEPDLPAQIAEETKENTAAKKPKPAEFAWPKSYVVSEDDSLGLVSVAKKFYGPEQGNRKINIDRIFQANRTLLKSPDDIYVGQKLTIPPPEGLQTKTKEDKSSFTDSLFEKVKSIGIKHLSTKSDDDKKSSPYVVRQDDNLWRIAVNQLGDGSRYNEIKELNANIIKNENDLTVGMLLRIPAQ